MPRPFHRAAPPASLPFSAAIRAARHGCRALQCLWLLRGPEMSRAASRRGDPCGRPPSRPRLARPVIARRLRRRGNPLPRPRRDARTVQENNLKTFDFSVLFLHGQTFTKGRYMCIFYRKQTIIYNKFIYILQYQPYNSRRNAVSNY